MGEPYLKQWLNTSECLSQEIKDISSDFVNGYLLGEILHKHKLIPNFHLYKNSSKHSDISKNYQYLSKAFDDLNIKFNDTRRNDILNKKKGVAAQIIFKLKQVIDQKLLSKENLKMQKGPNELHKLYKNLIYPNDNEKYFKDLLNRKALRNKKKNLDPISQFLSKEGKFYIDIGKEIEKDKIYLDEKRKTMYNSIHDVEMNRGKFCKDKDNEGLENWNKQMDIKKNFEKKQLEEQWKETNFYKTATFGSFKNSNKSNINQIDRFNQNLSRLGLDVNEQNNGNVSNIKKNYMSPQIILKMYRDKIAEQEKSRKDKEKRMRKMKREEDKLFELSKNNRTQTRFRPKKILIESKDKDKQQKSEEVKFMTINEMNKKLYIDDYAQKKKDFEEVLFMHKKEKLLNLPKEEKEKEKITLPYKSMYDFFDKKIFFMGLDRLNTGYFKKKIEKRKLKDEKNTPNMNDIFEQILEIAEESDNYLQGHNCELIDIPQWDKWMQLLKSNVSLKEYLSEKEDNTKIEKKSVELLYENEDEDDMVKFKSNEFFDYLNFMGDWDFNIKEKIIEYKDITVSKIIDSDRKNNLTNFFFKNINPNTQPKIEDNPMELSLYKILGPDIAYILNAGKCEISGLKENALLKMKNKEFEPGTQDINNVTLPTKYNKTGHIGEIIEYFINMKYDKKEKEKEKETNSQNMKNNLNLNEFNEHKNGGGTIREETKKEIEHFEEQSLIAKHEINNLESNNTNTNNNMNNLIINNNNLLQSNDEFIEGHILEEIKEPEVIYTFDHIPIKICFIGTQFSGRKTQSLLLKEKYPNIKIYNIESMIKDIIELYNKINTPIEEQNPKSKAPKKNQNQIEQLKQEYETLKKENAFQLSIIEPLLQNEEKNFDTKKIIQEIPDEKLIDLILLNIKKDFPMKEKSQIEEEVNLRREKLDKTEKELESMTSNEDPNKKVKVNLKEKERLIKDKEQLINESYTGFIINDFPKTLEQFKLFEKKCTGFVEELDKEKEEKDLEKEELLYPLDKIYCPKNKRENIKSIFDKYCVFEVSDDEILKRKNGRLLDETTGIIYHNEYNPPDEKDKKLIERLKPITEPSDEKIISEIKKYYLDLIDVKRFIELFNNVYQINDLKDKNEENQNIINDVLTKIMNEFDNRYINSNNNNNFTTSKKASDSGKTKEKNASNIENKESKENNNNDLNTLENNVSNINSIKNNNNANNNLTIRKETSIGNISVKNSKSCLILPVMSTPLSKFNKRYSETKKRLSLSNLDIHFLNKWNLFLSEYKFSLLRNFVNIYNIKQLILNETVKIEEEYKQFLNLPSNKKDIIDRFTNKLSQFRSQFKDIKGHQLVLEEFHKDLTDLTNGIWDIINQRKQKAIEKREQIMQCGFFEKQIKHFYENIENLFVQETKKFLLSVNIIKEFYYGLQSEILKSVILPFTSQIENIDINNIFKDTENLELINTTSNTNGQLKFPKMEKMFYNCMKIIFYLDYAIRTVEDKLKGNIEDLKPGANKEANNSGTLSMVSKSRLTKKKRKKNKDVSISEERKEVFNFLEETNSSIEIEKYNYKYRLLSIKFYAMKFLTDLNNISNELFTLLDTWIIDSVHYQNQMMNKLLERLSKIVDNTSLKIIWDFELDKYTLMKTKKFEFIDSYTFFLDDDNEGDNREIRYGKYIPILISLYNDLNNFSLQNEFIDKNVLIEIMFKKNISSIELKNTPIYKVNFHMYQKIIDLMTVQNKKFLRKDLININHFFTILLLLPFPIIKESEIENIKNNFNDKIISKCYLKENDFKEINLWFEKNKIFKNDDEDDNGFNSINMIKNFLGLLYNKNGLINFEEFLNVISLNILVDNNEIFEKDKYKLYKDLFF